MIHNRRLKTVTDLATAVLQEDRVAVEDTPSKSLLWFSVDDQKALALMMMHCPTSMADLLAPFLDDAFSFLHHTDTVFLVEKTPRPFRARAVALLLVAGIVVPNPYIQALIVRSNDATPGPLAEPQSAHRRLFYARHSLASLLRSPHRSQVAAYFEGPTP